MENSIATKELRGTIWKCSNCHALITPEDNTCWDCGVAFDKVKNVRLFEETIAVAKPVPKFLAIPFEFTGTAGEYFKIWIVNTCLTILTLGVYSAWAKVRKLRYFYGNTLLLGSPFEYLAEPLRILIGRLLVLGLFVAYVLAVNYAPLLGLCFALLFFGISPWLVVKALIFKTRNSSYRNIRFDFWGNYHQAAGIFIGINILVGMTLGLLYPYFAFRRSQFVLENCAYGNTSFNFTATAKNFYEVYLKVLVLFIIGIALVIFFFSLFFSFNPFMSSLDEEDPTQTFFLYFFLALLVYLPIVVYLKTAIPNLVWSNVVLNSNQFVSTMKFSKMLWLYLSNVVAIIISAGLLIPWASIRLTRYRLENLNLLTNEELDSYEASEYESVSATGEEMSDFFDFDVGF